MYCPGCEVFQENVRGETCEVCGEVLLERIPDHPLGVSDTKAPGPKYPAAQALVTVFRGLGYLAIVAGILIAATGILARSEAGIAFSAVAIGSAMGILIVFLAAAEGIKIMIDIEANTRASLEYMRRCQGDMN